MLCNISSYVQETAWNDQGHNFWLQQMEGRGEGNHARVIKAAGDRGSEPAGPGKQNINFFKGYSGLCAAQL